MQLLQHRPLDKGLSWDDDHNYLPAAGQAGDNSSAYTVAQPDASLAPSDPTGGLFQMDQPPPSDPGIASIVALLDHDERPAFITESRTRAPEREDGLQLVYRNPALMGLLTHLPGHQRDQKDALLDKWVQQVHRTTTQHAPCPAKWASDGLTWKTSVVRSRWMVTYLCHVTVLPAVSAVSVLDTAIKYSLGNIYGDLQTRLTPPDEHASHAPTPARAAVQNSPRPPTQARRRSNSADASPRGQKRKRTQGSPSTIAPVPIPSPDVRMQDTPTASASDAITEEDSPRPGQDQDHVSESMFKRLVDAATVGCAVFGANGYPIWLNESYLTLTGLDMGEFRAGNWRKAILPEDLPLVEQRWRMLASGEPMQPFEFRVKRSAQSPSRAEGSEFMDCRWLLSNGFTDLNPDGSIRTVMGWLTDISHQKWSEHLQAQRLEDVLENKRQTEKFIDMVSHEIRNPLSAIIQTADGILNSIDRAVKARTDDMVSDDSSLRENITDAANTIILCAQHQKGIVDDILTLSKLDSSLVIISPDPVQPRALVKKALKMFQAGLHSAQIETSFTVEPPFQEMSIHTVLLDESRVIQVLINLLTNAIKFTRHKSQGMIKIRLSASYREPSLDTGDVSYISPRVCRMEQDRHLESGIGEDIYVIFTVEDNGRGLNSEEMKLLFHRFSQASPKTYGQYGGSGLGLFICRELVELQGGQIGLASVPGQGTTFTFYIKARREVHPPLFPPKFPSAATSPITLETATTQCDRSDSSPSGTKGIARFRRSSTSATEVSVSSTVASSNVPNAATKKRTSRSAAANSTATEELHILLVEDNFINQKVMVQQLCQQDCVVYVADHGLEALEFLEKTEFWVPDPDSNPDANRTVTDQDDATSIDRNLLPPPALGECPSPAPVTTPIPLSCILCDLEMPVMDGLSCVTKIRDMQRAGRLKSYVPVIAVTANARSEQISKAMDAGMDLVLTKPFRIAELLPRMRALVRQSQKSKAKMSGSAAVTIGAEEVKI